MKTFFYILSSIFLFGIGISTEISHAAGYDVQNPHTGDHSVSDSTKNNPPPVAGAIVLPGQTNEQGVEMVRDKLLPKITNIILVTGMSLSVLLLMISGVMYIMSSGDNDMTEKAKLTMTWAIAGIAVMTLSFAIVQIIVSIDFTGK